MPSGGLGLLPLGLAQEPSAGRRLLDTYEIVMAPSLSALSKAMRGIERPAAPSLAAVVNPTGDLIFAPIEGALVAAHFEPERRALLDEFTGSPDAVLAALRGKTHWHFSTHGTFDLEEARRSALAMRGGAPLSVGSLLQADDLGRPRLVVLSACETGLHDIERAPEEFIGLPGAFMTIGALAVLGTLWAIDDRATSLLTARFYDLHLDEGLAPATALRNAQLWLRFATREELAGYARAAASQGRLSTHHARLLELALAGAAGEGVRFFDIAAPEVVPDSGADGGGPVRAADDSRSERPFAHPVYWGGFVITGF
jgi:CHAT domain-containing protein